MSLVILIAKAKCMADPSPNSPPDTDDSTKNSEPTGYKRVARKWSRLSSNLLASGLVIVAAIGLLRYVAPWWSQEEPPSSEEHVAQTVGQGVHWAYFPDSVIWLTRFGKPSMSANLTALETVFGKCVAELQQKRHTLTGKLDLQNRKC